MVVSLVRSYGMTTLLPSGRFDLAIVGAGIIGLATALAAARRGLRVVVIDRDAQANGASVRNFGFITVTGQERGAMWSRAPALAGGRPTQNRTAFEYPKLARPGPAV